MALGKNSRSEGKNLSNYCSTVSVAVFVAFCLVGIWIVMSSIAPIQNSVMQVSETINEAKNIASESGSEQFEGRLGDIQEESPRRDSQTNKSNSESHQENQDDQKGIEKVSDNTTEDNLKEIVGDMSGEDIDLRKGHGNTIEDNDQTGHVRPSTDEKEGESNGNLNTESVETETPDGQIDDNKLRGSMETLDERKSDKFGTEKSIGEVTQQDEIVGVTEEEGIKKNLHSKTNQSAGESNTESHENSPASKEASVTGTLSETPIEVSAENGTWSTQVAESQHEMESQKSSISIDSSKYDWKLCKTTTGSEYIPCLDNWQAIKKLRSISHYQHRERHCPDKASTCLIPLPEGYRSPIRWPKSREMVCNTQNSLEPVVNN